MKVAHSPDYKLAFRNSPPRTKMEKLRNEKGISAFFRKSEQSNIEN